MSCDCATKVRATGIALAGGNVTITVPATVTFTDGQLYDIGLFTSIPAGTGCCTIQVTNGTDTYYVMNNAANYFRPCVLRCRSVLRVLFLSDPAHLLHMR